MTDQGDSDAQSLPAKWHQGMADPDRTAFRQRLIRQHYSRHSHQKSEEADPLDFIHAHPDKAPWDALLNYVANGVGPKLDKLARSRAIIGQLCKLLSANDTHLAAAAASAIASTYEPNRPCFDGRYYPVLREHVQDIGAVLGNTNVVGQMVAMGPPFAAGRLAVAAGSGLEIRADAKLAEGVAAALLPGLLPAMVVACKCQPREFSYGACIFFSATLGLAASQLQPPAGSAGSRHLSNPRLLQQALRLAEAAQSCMDGAFEAVTACLDPACPEMRQNSLTAAQMDRVLAVFARALPYLIVGIHTPNPAKDERSKAMLAATCQMLWLCTSDVLPAAVKSGSPASVKAVIEAATEVLEHGAHDTELLCTGFRTVLLVAARVVRTVSAQATLTREQWLLVGWLLEDRVLTNLDTLEPAWLLIKSLFELPPAWQPYDPKRNITRDLYATVLLTDELAAVQGNILRDAFAAPQPCKPAAPSGLHLSALVTLLTSGVVEPLAAYMAGETSRPYRLRRLQINKTIRLPGEPYPGCPLGVERAVAAVALQLGEVCMAAMALPEQQLRPLLLAQCEGDGRTADALAGELPWRMAQAAGMLLGQLGRELQQLDAAGDAGEVDALWPRLRAVLLALAGGAGRDAPRALEPHVIDSVFVSAQAITAPAVIAKRGDIVVGLCDLLERLLQRRPLAPEHLHGPAGWPPMWRETARRLGAITFDHQLRAETEPAIARVSAALERALQETAPQQVLQQEQQQPAGRATAAEAADRMAQLLLQEEDAEKQQRAAKAARKKKRRQATAAGAPSAPTAPAAPAGTAAGTAAGAADFAATVQPGADSSTNAAPAAESAQQPHPGTAAAADEAAADPHAWRLCPLTKVVMVDPVLLPADGHSYERAAIVDWLEQHGTSPLTQQPADVKTLTPNHALRNLLQAFATTT